jgi:site-specific DNA recombinase
VNKTTQTVRCAIYTRKSTEEGLEQEFNTLDAQREAGEAYIASQRNEGWQCLPELYDDGGFSGGNLERPALARLLADIAAGKIDCVVVYKVDRLSRSLLDFAKIMEVFDKQQVAFVSVTQQFNTASSMGRLVLNVLLSFAQFEREIIGERIRDKIAAQRRKGKWSGGFPILGYDVDRSSNSPKLVINALEAKRVREIFQLYLSLGSMLPVVQELNKRHWVTKCWRTKRGAIRGGLEFDRGSLYALLTNKLYVGKVKHKSNIYNGEHEAIIAQELFDQVQLRLYRNGKTGGPQARNRYNAQLRGLLICKTCGHTMVHTFVGKDKKQYRYYTCTKAIKRGRDKCSSGSLPAAEIERMVVEQIRCIATDQLLRREVLSQAQSHIEQELLELNTQRRQLEKELTRHQAEIEKIALTGSINRHASARLADLQQSVSQSATQLANLKQKIDDCEHQQVTESDVKAAFAEFKNTWDLLSPREQVRLIELLITRVEYDAIESTIEVSFHPTAIHALAQRQQECLV